MGTHGQTAQDIMRYYVAGVRVMGRLNSGMQVVDKKNCSYAKQHRGKKLAIDMK